MKLEIKKYDEQRSYIEYSHDGKTFTNANYFMFDIGKGTFEDCKRCGGFYANMTWRYIQNNNLDNVKYIMLCDIPQMNAHYKFLFVYLDKDLNIKSRTSDNNFSDYFAFYNYFKSLITKEGFVYELEKEPSLIEITQQFRYSPTADFGFDIDGKQIQFDDKLIYKDFDINIFKDEDIKENLKKVNAKDMILQLQTSPWAPGSSFEFKCNILDKDENVIKEYQAEEGFVDLDECADEIYKRKNIRERFNISEEEWRKEFKRNEENNNFEFSLPFNYVLNKKYALSFYEPEQIKKELEDIDEPDIL